MTYINFFGYGAYKDKLKISQVTGSLPRGYYGAVAEGYILGYQLLSQIPYEPREILKNVWGSGFRAYTLKVSPNRRMGLVSGVIWKLTSKQLKMIKLWEFVGSWRKVTNIKVRAFDGNYVEALTDISLEDQDINEIVDGLNYESDLNPQGRKNLKSPQFNGDLYRLRQIAKIREDLEKLKTQR